jgi:hypothetical protein
VFKIREGANGEVERYKAKLLAKGFTQTYRLGYNETFTFVAKFTSIHCILALVAFENMETHQMEQPQGFGHQGSEHLVCKLDNSLYGLK